jgi:hypothetical protein
VLLRKPALPYFAAGTLLRNGKVLIAGGAMKTPTLGEKPTGDRYPRGYPCILLSVLAIER